MSLPVSSHATPPAPDLLVTRRLTLRPMVLDDVDALHALLIQPGVRRHLCDGRLLPRADVAAMLAISVQLRAASGAGLWALAENARPAASVGFVGLWPCKHVELAPPVSELAFALAESHWGRGLATEAGGAMLDYARDALGRRDAQASTDLGNNAAIRTLWRLDFTEAEIVRGAAGPLRIFRRSL